MVAVVAHDGARLSAGDVVPLRSQDGAGEGLVGLREGLSAFGHLLTVLRAKSESLAPGIGGRGDGALEEGGGHVFPGRCTAWCFVEAFTAVVWRYGARGGIWVVAPASVVDDVGLNCHAGEGEEKEGVEDGWEGESHGYNGQRRNWFC